MIYLDNSATSQPCDVAIACAREMLEAEWFNPSALYAQAMHVERRLEAARAAIAGPLGVKARQVVFTGSGTEADSLAILGTAARFRRKRRVLLFAAEHPAVRETQAQLEAMGHAVHWIPATEEGLVDLEALSGMLTEDVGLISCMHVGNETGAIQPASEVAALLRSASPEGLLHVDGVQAYLRLPTRMAALGADLYTVSGHKVHAPKGIGALAIREGVRLMPRVAGGGQEGGLRSGTENTAGIAAFGAAVQWAQAQQGLCERLRAMKLGLYARLRQGVDGLRVNGPAPDGAHAAPHILNVSFPGVGGEVMVHALEQRGVLAGTGAACSSKRRKVSAAFEAMRAPRWAAESAVRFSFGLLNTMDDAERAAEAAIACFQRYRAFQRR